MMEVAMIMALLGAAAAANTPVVSEPLNPLSFLVGHCWKGEFKARAQTDTHCFVPVYGGKHVRDRHEVRESGGKVVYAGETLYSWNGKAKRIEYTYVSSDGGVSHGTVAPTAPGELDFGDQVYNGPDGRELKISTSWRRDGDAAYESVSRGGANPTGERVVRFARVDPASGTSR